MKKNQIQKNIPTNWQQVTLGDICKVNQGLQIPISERVSTPEAGAKLYITTQFLNGKSEAEYIRVFTDSVICKKDDILMTRTGNSGILVTGVEGVFHNNFFKVNPKNNINSKLLVYNLVSPYVQYKLLKLAGTSTIPDLNHGDFYSIDLLLPPLPEQNRIVSVLETWDSLIEKLTKKIEFKKQIKKRLMQDLLTGKKRLNGFNDKWETITIGDLGEYYSGLTGKNKEDFGFGKPFISYMNIYSNPRVDTNIRDLVNIKPTDNQNQVKYGDLFFTTSSETPDEVGVSSVLLDKNIGEIYLNSFCFGFRLHNFEKLTPEFSQHYFRTRHFRKSMFEIAQGASRYNLSKKYFIQIEIKIPKSTKEQSLIADILNASDYEIELLQDKLKLLQEQKRYLLNNLITGTIRTPETLSTKITK